MCFQGAPDPAGVGREQRVLAVGVCGAAGRGGRRRQWRYWGRLTGSPGQPGPGRQSAAQPPRAQRGGFRAVLWIRIRIPKTDPDPHM